MSSKEQRRFPKRYATQIPVEFMDKTKAKGTLINLSRDGMLVVAKKLKPLNSFVRLKVNVPGVARGIEINGKVVRHTMVNEENAMGIRFLEMDAADRDSWMKHISSLTQSSFSMALMEQSIMDERSISVEPFDGKESTFILKFKSLQRMEDFFPQDWKSEDFFIRTNIKKNKGDKVIIKLIHPVSNEELKLNVLVRKYGRHPLKVHKEGIFFNIIGYNSKIEAKIRKFLGIEAYEG
jgi:hypothetical protein